jgi:SAM-dependent methyltransferase
VADALAQLKERTKAGWTLGDYSKLGRILEPASEELVEACGVSAGQQVLDVAAGDGNAALAAARRGARVVASDLTPALVEMGRERSRAEGFDIEWAEADAEDLPFEDESFDCVVSAFGAMFAPRPEVAAFELFRVARPGGTVGMASWPPESWPGQLFDLANRYLPRPEGVPPPVEWGVEEVVRSRFDGLAADIELRPSALPFRFESAEGMWDFFSENAGNVAAARRELSEERYERLHEDFVALVEDLNEASVGSVDIRAEYLIVVARRREALGGELAKSGRR